MGVDFALWMVPLIARSNNQQMSRTDNNIVLACESELGSTTSIVLALQSVSV